MICSAPAPTRPGEIMLTRRLVSIHDATPATIYAAAWAEAFEPEGARDRYLAWTGSDGGGEGAQQPGEGDGQCSSGRAENAAVGSAARGSGNRARLEQHP